MAKPVKQVQKKIKLQIPAGKANPSPPVGPALGQAGVNIMDFCNSFNEATRTLEGPIPVVISVYKDRSFTFVTKLPPTSYLVQKAAKVKKGSQTPGQNIVGKITMEQIREIAELKMPDLNAVDIDGASKMIAGTALSMGLEVVK